MDDMVNTITDQNFIIIANLLEIGNQAFNAFEVRVEYL